ncbi:hypothetical protein LPJ72_000815 [Coemansia sp. Benny D160-2]|nr:hypothetical protein LPJ72_000815 [Coemansia sp. Benny D160-2]
MRSPSSSSSGYLEGHTKKSRKGRKRSASIATTSAHSAPPVTSRSAQSSGTYADAAVAATLAPETPPPLQLDPSHGSANTTPNKHSSRHHGKQKRKHSNHRRGRSGGGSRAVVAAGSKESSPMSTHTLTEEGEAHGVTALASYDSSGGDGVGLKQKSSCASEMMLVMEALEPLTVAVATTVPAGEEEEDLSNQNQSQLQLQQPLLATLGEEEDDAVADEQPPALASNIQQQSAADLEALAAEAPEQDRCTVHPGARNDLWCQTCSQAICSRCIEGPAATGISSGIGHRLHSVVKLAAAYDDTYETIEMLQLKLLRNLAETRNRTTLLDSAASDLDGSLAQASNQLEQNTQADAERIEGEFHAIHAEIDAHRADCQLWRSAIEDTLSTVQSVMDGVTQAQAVAQCDALVGVMETAARARPLAWAAELPPSAARLMGCVRPAAFFFALRVPSVTDLGRRRGHVRVAGAPASAHGAVWAAEARRSRNALGEPCLAVAVTCVEGPPSSSPAAMAVGVDVAAPAYAGDSAQTGERRHFAQWHAASWTQTQTHTFTVCTLDELERSGVLASSSPSSAGDSGAGDVVVRIGVRPESFRALALAQGERIRVLEERLRRATERPADPTAAALDQTVCSVRPSRRRRSDARGWATSPRASGRRSDVHQMFARPGADDSIAGARRPSLAPMLPLPVLPPQQQPPPQLVPSLSAQQQQLVLSPPLSPSPSSIAGGGDLLDQNQSPSSQSQFHRRAVSLTTKLRRQPPIPFPLAMRTRSVQSSVTMMHVASGANGSQTSVASKSSLSALARLAQPFGNGSSSNDAGDDDDGDGKPGMLRRLSGWMRSTAAEGRTAAHRARRARRLASSGGIGGGSSLALGDDASIEEEEIDDWTFLDGEVMSPQQKQPLPEAEEDAAAAAEAEAALCKRHAGRCLAPSVPLPPLPLAEPAAVVAADDDIEAGFAFDGAADIEREQAEVDARARRLRTDGASSSSDLQARYDSIVQRIDALQLIANTVENSRDGLTEGTLRRISSELGVLLDGRRRRIEDARARAATTASGAGMSPSPLGFRRPVTAGANDEDDGDDDGLPPLMAAAHSRRSFSMDPAEIRRAVARAVVEQPAGGPLQRNSRDSNGRTSSTSTTNGTSNRSTSSNGSSRAGSPRRGQTPGSRRVSVGSGSGPGSRVVRPIRRDSISTAAAVGSDTDGTQHQQLTPQTRRQGGILKAGRTRRAMPTARLPGSSGPDFHGVAASNAASASTASNSSTPRRSSGSEPAPPSFSLSLSLSQPRTPRSAGARKRVRFPEEQRLLETIRLVDPQIAQSIETRAAAAASLVSPAPQQRAEPAASAPAPAVAGKMQSSAGNARWSDNDSEGEEDEEQRVTGLAARVRSSPRLSPKLPDDPGDSDSNSSDSLESPASCRFNTATSVLFDEATDLPIALPAAPPVFKRPPLPRPPASLHMVLGHDYHQQQPGLPEPLLSESKQRGWKRRASLAVGPNVGSAHSSPVAAPFDQYPLLGGEGSNISSPLSDVAVFGGDYEDAERGSDQGGAAATARLWSYDLITTDDDDAWED